MEFRASNVDQYVKNLISGVFLYAGLTIIGSSAYGGALIALSADYFLSRAKMGHWVLSMISLKTPQPVCWFSWAAMGLWPGLVLIGIVTQFCLTGRGVHHERSEYGLHSQIEAELVD